MSEEIQNDDTIYWLQPEEETPEMNGLFQQVDALIINYVAKFDGEEKSIRRFVAGSVCRNDLQQLRESMPRAFKAKNVSAYNVFISDIAKEKVLDVNDEEDRKKISKLWEEKKQDSDVLKALQNCADVINARNSMAPADPRTRIELFKKHKKILFENIKAMYTNYRSHIFLVCATETMSVGYNSSVSTNTEAAKNSVFSITDNEGMSLNLKAYLEMAIYTQQFTHGLHL